MKKRILLVTSLICLLLVALALGVSAEGSTSNEYGTLTTIEGVTAPSTIDSTSRVVLLASDGTYYTVPAYYILEDQEIFRWKKNADVSSMLGYSSSNANSDFRPYVVRMEIPEGITSINPGTEGGAYAFEDAKKIIEVTLPSTLTVIGNYSFNRANALAMINGFEAFMQRATKIGTMMLAQTAWGEGVDLVIPTQITSLPNECFRSTKINSVSFHSGITYIGSYCFGGCANIKSVVLPESLVNLKNQAFASCKALESIDVSRCTSLQEIGEYAFEYAVITSFDFTPFASTLTTIGNGLFNECSSLTTVTAYENVSYSTVGAKMFYNTGITKITFPKGVTSIGEYAYYGVKASVYVDIPDTVTTIDQYAFSNSSITGASLPTSLQKLKNHVFARCSSMTVVDTTGCTQITYIGKYCFEHCGKLEAFDFTPFAEVFTTFEINNGASGAFNSCGSLATVTGLDKLNNITTLPHSLFYNCPLTNISISENVTVIGDHVFFGHRSTQTELRIPNGVTSIGNHAFTRGVSGGASSVAIYLPANLTSVANDYTFENWYYTEMYIPASLTNVPVGFCNKTLSKGVVYYYTGDLNGLTIHSTNNSAMLNAEWISVDEFVSASSEKNYIVYNYNHCDAFYRGIHDEKTEDNNSCFVADCTRCDVVNLYIGSDATHVYKVSIGYTSYYQNGEKVTICQNEGCTYCLEEVASPLFTCNGYSIPEDDRIAVAITYAINKNAVAEYKSVNSDFEYGVFAVLENKIGTNDLFKEDGSLTTNSVCANLTSEPLVAVTLKITGFTTDEHKALGLAMGIYVKQTVEGQTKYTYVQAKGPEEGQKYSFISYNGVPQ